MQIIVNPLTAMASSQESAESTEVVQARANAVISLMTRLTEASPIYNYLLSDMILVSAMKGQVTTRLTLSHLHVNSKGSLHGAVSATIIDFTTGLAIASWDLRETTGASVDMHISYLSGAAKIGDMLEVESKAERVGGSLAFVTIKIVKVEGDTRTLVTMGQHTKYVQGTGPERVKKEVAKS